MRNRRAFTLIEMLAVIGIMLVLMVATFGAFSLFAERMGPGEAQATLQGYLNGARSYAAANGVQTRLEFSVNVVRNDKGGTGPAMQDGTVVTIKYLPPDITNDTPTDWKEIPGTSRVMMGNGIFVIKGIPLMPTSSNFRRTLTEGNIAGWRSYEDMARKEVNTAVVQAMATMTPTNPSFVQFDPAGYLVESSTVPQGMAPSVQGLTIVKLVGGDWSTSKTSQYRFFLLNAYSGTRLVFD
jgi:prepilin-type N-terminal cleavage/methylation domain-containing protein